MLMYSLTPADLGFDLDREPVIENVLLSDCVPEDEDRDLMLADQRELESFWYDQRKPIVRQRPTYESEVEDQAPVSPWSSLVTSPSRAEACSVIRSALACIDPEQSPSNGVDPVSCPVSNKPRGASPQAQGLPLATARPQSPRLGSEPSRKEAKRDWLTGGDFLINRGPPAPRGAHRKQSSHAAAKKKPPRSAARPHPSPQAKPKHHHQQQQTQTQTQTQTQPPSHAAKKHREPTQPQSGKKKRGGGAKKAAGCSPAAEPRERPVFAGVSLGKRPSADAVKGSRRERLVRFVTNAVGPGRVSGVLRRLRELGVVEVGDLAWLERSDFAVAHVADSDVRALFNAIAFMSSATCLSVPSAGKVHPSSGSSWSLSSAATTTHTHDSGVPRVWSGEYPVSIGAAHNKHPFSYLRPRASH
ncbi:hypothetical protein DIPPA_06326 [Diplonema papillatum]|nr:hypothetical protein DIPPA_06326 [Diplonema papillatum]|eukprot:gene12020-18565_t